MKDNEIKDRLDKVYHRVNANPSFALPVVDLPVDRILAVKVSEVIDLIGDMDLIEVHRLVELAERIGMDDEAREQLEKAESAMKEIVRGVVEEQIHTDQQEEQEE
jgi:hypothetical protein